MDALITAFGMVFDPGTVLVMLGASLFGLFVGAVPGLTATMAPALLVPVRFFMPPIPAIAAIVTATASASYAGDANHLGSSDTEVFVIGQTEAATVFLHLPYMSK